MQEEREESEDEEDEDMSIVQSGDPDSDPISVSMLTDEALTEHDDKDVSFDGQESSSQDESADESDYAEKSSRNSIW